MSTRIYVENLPATTTREELTSLFAPYGNVVDVNLAADRNNLQPLGFGFVTMVTAEGARAAVEGLNGRQMSARTLIVTAVRPPSAGPADTPAPPKNTGPHPLPPAMKRNTIIPTTPARDQGKAK